MWLRCGDVWCVSGPKRETCPSCLMGIQPLGLNELERDGGMEGAGNKTGACLFEGIACPFILKFPPSTVGPNKQLLEQGASALPSAYRSPWDAYFVWLTLSAGSQVIGL